MKRFSIGLLMAIIFFVAADFAIVRGLWNAPGSALNVAVLTLPMSNFLILFSPKARAGRATRLFWMGFEAGGCLMVLLVATFTWLTDLILFPVSSIDDHDGISRKSTAEVVLLISFAVVFYTTPQVLVATATGRLVARYRLVIERRPVDRKMIEELIR